MSVTQLHKRKCSGCGHIQDLKEGDECASCGEDSKWRYLCERHNKMFVAPVCDVCERAAEEEEAARRAYEEEQERRRQAAEERERRRQEYEREQQRQYEEAMLQEKAFMRIARVPAYIALAASLSCLALTAQFFTHGAMVIPYTAPLLFTSLGIGIVAALSIFIIAFIVAVFGIL